MFFKLGILGVGETFGEEHLVLETSRTYSVLCYSAAGRLRILQKKDFLFRLEKDEISSQYLEKRVMKKNEYYKEKIKENSHLKNEQRMNLFVPCPFYEGENLKKMKNYLLLKKPIINNSYADMIDEEISKSREFLKKSRSFIFNNMLKIQEDRK